jgi:hypothetical protein
VLSHLECAPFLQHEPLLNAAEWQESITCQDGGLARYVQQACILRLHCKEAASSKNTPTGETHINCNGGKCLMIAGMHHAWLNKQADESAPVSFI